jgi:lysine 2,3-aminomutase
MLVLFLMKSDMKNNSTGELESQGGNVESRLETIESEQRNQPEAVPPMRPAVLKRHSFAYNRRRFVEVARDFIDVADSANHVEIARARLFERASRFQLDSRTNLDELYKGNIVRVRDCARALKTMLESRSEALADFSIANAIYDIAKGVRRPDLGPGFYADMMHIFLGIQGKGPGQAPALTFVKSEVSGRRAAKLRSRQLDQLWNRVEKNMARYRHGLEAETIARRRARKAEILKAFGGSEADWDDPAWQLRHVVRDAETLKRVVNLSADEEKAVMLARKNQLPFGVTPYYLSLFDRDRSGRDRAVRAQVLPPMSYVSQMSAARASGESGHDFMMEEDTSPIDLITRRYPGIVIFKPYNTCPQICVYCQRNWEISDVLCSGALAPKEKIQKALAWIRAHPAIREVLLTGGDPLTVRDETLRQWLDGLAEIPSVERIRIGTRTLVTMPMRITEDLAALLSSYHEPGRREIAVATHVEHPYEITPQLVEAAQRIRRAGISVYNQLVYTFFVSRRFEATLLRRLLRKAGIDPYYAFATKGKEETAAYRIPLARLLQEVQEEARLLPGLERTDEPVYNVPALGKNHVRAVQHRDLIAIRGNGARVFEFHSWEKNISSEETYTGDDVPILDYLERLRRIGESPADYETIWYYF